jgi:cytochrome c556
LRSARWQNLVSLDRKGAVQKTAPSWSRLRWDLSSTAARNNLPSGALTPLVEIPMKRRAAITFTAALLALGLFSMTVLRADDEDEEKAIKEAQVAVLKLVDSMKNNKGDVKAQVEALHKKFEELKPIMWIYKPRNKKGLGMGKNGAGIENELARLSGTKARPNPANDPMLKSDLIKAAEISKAIAEVTDLYAPKKDAPKWKGYTKDMKKSAEDLLDTVKGGGNTAQVKKALTNLNASCTNCHSDFRE